jgi:hypothetical protein
MVNGEWLSFAKSSLDTGVENTAELVTFIHNAAQSFCWQ